MLTKIICFLADYHVHLFFEWQVEVEKNCVIDTSDVTIINLIMNLKVLLSRNKLSYNIPTLACYTNKIFVYKQVGRKVECYPLNSLNLNCKEKYNNQKM